MADQLIDESWNVDFPEATEIDPEAQEIFVQDQNTDVIQNTTNAINQVEGLTPENRSLALAISLALTSTRQAGKSAKTIGIRDKPRPSTKLSEFELILTGNTVDEILGQKFRDFTFDSDLSKVLTKQSLIQKALRDIPREGAGNPERRVALEDALMDLDISNAIAQHTTKVSKDAVTRAKDETLSLSTLGADYVRPPPLTGRVSTLPSAAMKNASQCLSNVLLGDTKRQTKSYKYYLRLVRSIVINFDLSAKSAYEILLFVTTGAPYTFISNSLQDGRSFETTWISLQRLLREPSKMLLCKQELEKLCSTPPKKLGDVLLRVYNIHREINANLSLQKRKANTEAGAIASVWKILQRFYVYNYASIRSTWERMEMNAVINKDEDWQGYVALSGICDSQLSNVAPTTDKNQVLHVEEADVSESEGVVVEANSFGGARPRNFDRQPDRQQNRFRPGPEFNQRCFLCFSKTHRYRNCDKFVDKRFSNGVRCRYCTGYHADPKCYQMRNGAAMNEADIELDEFQEEFEPDFAE